MAKTVNIRLGFLLALGISACASHKDEAVSETEPFKGDRSPATLPQSMPYVPGRPTYGRPTPVAPLSHTGPAAPATPAPAKPEAPGGCNAAIFRSIPVNIDPRAESRVKTFSVEDLLTRPNQYNVLLTENEALDRSVLAQWFQGSTGPGSEIFNASRNAKPFCRALQYINGQIDNHCGPVTYEDYAMAPRFAAVLVAMMAVSANPECIREVRRRADIVICPWKSGSCLQAVKDLDALPLVEAAQMVHDGQMDKAMSDLEAKRADDIKQMKDIDDVIAGKEKAHAKEVQAAVKMIWDGIKKEQKCSYMPDVSLAAQLYDQHDNGRSLASVDADPAKLDYAKAKEQLDACEQAFKDHLADLKDRQHAEHDKIAEKLSATKGKLSQADEDSINLQLKDISDAATWNEKQIAFLESLKKKASMTQHIEDYAKYAQNPTEKLKATLFAPEQTKKAGYQADLDKTDARYTTYWYLGGYQMGR